MQKIILLEKHDNLSWALFPYAVERAKKFLVKYGKGKPEVLEDLLITHFTGDVPYMVLAVGYEKGRGVFGHCLAAIDEIFGERILTIIQYEIDKDMRPKINRDEVAKMWQTIQGWGLSHGAKEVQLLTHSDKLVTFFNRAFGFRKEQTVMRKKIGGN